MAIPWTVGRSMPGSTQSERCKVENEVADFLCSQGYAVMNMNTTDHRRASYKLSPEAQAKHLAVVRSPEYRATMSAAMRGKKRKRS